MLGVFLPDCWRTIQICLRPTMPSFKTDSGKPSQPSSFRLTPSRPSFVGYARWASRPGRSWTSSKPSQRLCRAIPAAVERDRVGGSPRRAFIGRSIHRPALAACVQGHRGESIFHGRGVNRAEGEGAAGIDAVDAAEKVGSKGGGKLPQPSESNGKTRDKAAAGERWVVENYHHASIAGKPAIKPQPPSALADKRLRTPCIRAAGFTSRVTRTSRATAVRIRYWHICSRAVDKPCERSREPVRASDHDNPAIPQAQRSSRKARATESQTR